MSKSAIYCSTLCKNAKYGSVIYFFAIFKSKIIGSYMSRGEGSTILGITTLSITTISITTLRIITLSRINKT